MRYRRALAAAGMLVLAGLPVGCSPAPGPRNSTGEVTQQATTDAFAIKVGDCTGPISNGSVDTLSLVPCGEEHAWEAYARTELTGDDYPGSSRVQDMAEKFCFAEFQRFVGVSAGTSKYRATFLQPTKQTWEQAGDREVVCLVGQSAGGIEGTLRAANA